MKINDTESYCTACGKWHPAMITAENGLIYFSVSCPRGGKKLRISSDAEIFLSIRNRSTFCPSHNPANPPFTWMNVLELTDDCNLHCAVCYAASVSGGYYMNAEKALALARGLAKKGLGAVTLSGGEPTIHPECLSIARGIRALGMDVTMLTNGIRIGEDGDFSGRIRKSGMTFTYFQFDSLNEKVTAMLRGEGVHNIKCAALENAARAGLYFGIISTIIRANIGETGDIIRLAAGKGPGCYVLCFVTAVRAGRFLIEDKEIVDREEVITSVIASGAVRGLSLSHFRPFPRYLPLGLDVHPDCAALAFCAVRDGLIEPLDRYYNIDRLYRLMARAEWGPGIIAGKALFVALSLLCVRPAKVLALTRMMVGLARRKGRNGILVIAVEQFMGEHYQDRQRLERCASANVLPDGSLLSPCVFNHPDRARHPMTRGNKRLSQG